MLKTNKNTTIFRLCEEEKKKRCLQRLTVFQRPPARDDRRAPLEVRVGRQADGSDVVLPHQSLFERYQSDVVLLWRFGCLLALVEKLVVYWRAHLRNYILREESNEIYVTITVGMEIVLLIQLFITYHLLAKDEDGVQV